MEFIRLSQGCMIRLALHGRKAPVWRKLIRWCLGNLLAVGGGIWKAINGCWSGILSAWRGDWWVGRIGRWRVMINWLGRWWVESEGGEGISRGWIVWRGICLVGIEGCGCKDE